MSSQQNKLTLVFLQNRISSIERYIRVLQIKNYKLLLAALAVVSTTAATTASAFEFTGVAINLTYLKADDTDQDDFKSLSGSAAFSTMNLFFS